MAKDTTKILAAFLAGALAGAGLGLLLAPDKGSETRKKIKQKFTDLTEKGKETFNKMKNKGTTTEENNPE